MLSAPSPASFPGKETATEPTDRRLQNWVTSVHAGIAVSLDPPATHASGRGVSLYLMEMLHATSNLTARPAPLQLNLRYLVTAWSDTPEEAHLILADLAFAAMANPGFEVELDPLPIAAWSAFGLPPMPSFVLRVPLRQPRPLPAPRLVRQLQISSSPMVQLYGVLLGPEDLPITDARVEVISPRRFTSTDRKGRFHFPAVPAGASKQLRILARGRELFVHCDTDYPDKKAPFVIHFTPLEN